MNKINIIFTLFTLSILYGCSNQYAIKSPNKEHVLLTVDFHEGRTLRYEFVSDRETNIDWTSAESSSGNNEPVVDKSTEKLDLIMAYTPIKIDLYGLTTIKAECQAAKVTRTKDTQKDAAEYFSGKSYTFTADSTGKIHDYSQLEDLIKQVAEKAFIDEPELGRIKQPDMIGDFIAAQWFLWDSISSIKNPSQGVSIGQSWTSKLSVPTPMISRLARNVTYKLDELRQNDNESVAVISSTYSKSDSVPSEWPVPYKGRIRMRGTFGLLQSYKLIDLTGNGQELFNLDSGQIQEYNQQYNIIIQASFPMGISVKPIINIKQTISMKLIEE